MGKPIYIEKGQMIKGYPNLIPIIKNQISLHQMPISIDWLASQKNLNYLSIEDIQKEIFKQFFSNHYEFQSMETKRIDFSKDNILSIKSVQFGSELNFPAFSLFEFNNIILGFNPEPLINGKFTPITKVDYYNIKIPHVLRQAEIKRIPTKLQPNESLNILLIK